MRTFAATPLGGLFAFALLGCHLRAGFGPPPPAPPGVERTIIRDTVESKDGSKTVTESDTTRTIYGDGRSTTSVTNKHRVIGVDGVESQTSSQSNSENSANGSVTSSSSTSSGN